jgi:spore germination protein YaaH
MRENFSAFIQALGQSFDRSGLLLGVVVPTASNVDGNWDTGAYNWQAIGAASDYLQINLGLDPEAFASGPDRLVESMLRWGVGEVSRYKILLGLSALSVREVGSETTTVGYDEALSALGDVTVDRSRNRASRRGNPGQPGRIRGCFRYGHGGQLTVY